jgi:hypothetical protein
VSAAENIDEAKKRLISLATTESGDYFIWDPADINLSSHSSHQHVAASITVEKSSSHHLSQSEIAGDNTLFSTVIQYPEMFDGLLFQCMAVNSCIFTFLN